MSCTSTARTVGGTRGPAGAGGTGGGTGGGNGGGTGGGTGGGSGGGGSPGSQRFNGDNGNGGILGGIFCWGFW